jgi:ABC-type nitrate/sulfonate/bicarbonate transport system permease component
VVEAVVARGTIGRTAVAAALSRLVLAAGGISIVIALWWFVSLTTAAIRVPAPLDVWEAIQRDFWNIPAVQALHLAEGGIFHNAIYTMNTVLLGVGVGTAVGLAVGLLIARVRIARQLLEPPLLLLGTVPVIIVLPFLLIWFGTARFAQAGLVIFYSTLLVVIVTQNAVMNVVGRVERYAASLGATRLHLMRHVIVPAVVPEVIGAVRVTMAAGWGFATVAELLGAPRGAGRVIQAFTTTTATADIFAVLVCVGTLAVTLDAVVAAGGRWLGRWQE